MSQKTSVWLSTVFTATLTCITDFITACIIHIKHISIFMYGFYVFTIENTVEEKFVWPAARPFTNNLTNK